MRHSERMEALDVAVKEVLLQGATQVDIEISEQKSSVLYLVDEVLLEVLMRLKSEHDAHLCENESDSEKIEKLLKRYGSDQVCTIFNPHSSCHHYSIQVFRKYKYVTDPELVRKRLDEEYEVWVNAYRKETINKLKAQNASAESMQKNKREMEKHITQAKKELVYIKENFDKLDVRVSSSDRCREYATVHFNTEDSKRQTKRHVHISRFNVLWYKEREDNSMEAYIKKAEHPFGDVYYLPN